MGLFSKKADINDGVYKARNKSNAVLLDVRNPDEYRQGHIAGSINLPAGNISEIDCDEDMEIYVYCLSGARAARAVAYLKSQGYNAENIGGIKGYKGELVRGK